MNISNIYWGLLNVNIYPSLLFWFIYIVTVKYNDSLLEFVQN